MKTNKLKLNESKTEAMFITRKSQMSVVENLTLNIGDHKIEPSKIVRNLGGTFDNILSMKHQVSRTVQSGYYHLRRVKHIRQYLDQSTCAKVINATVTSRLDYHNGLLAGEHANIIKPLQTLQNNAARLLTRTGRREHITPILKTLHWLPVKYRVDFKILMTIHNALYDEFSPMYIKDTLAQYQHQRDLRSSDDASLLSVKRSYSHEGDRRLQTYGAKLWNDLPVNLRTEMAKQTFKKQLKTFLFRKAYL